MATSDTGFSVGREVGDDEVGIEVGADVGKAVEGTAVDSTDVVGSAVGAGDGRTVGVDVGK